jgi:peroxisomal membrane protein 2
MPMARGWSIYTAALEKNPLIVKSLTACIILGLGDISGQGIEGSTLEMKRAVDWGRVLRFAIFGLVLQAPWNHAYYLLLDGALPPTPEQPFSRTTFLKVFIDQFVQAPVFTAIIFVFLGILEGKTLSQIRYQLGDQYMETMIANCKLLFDCCRLL